MPDVTPVTYSEKGSFAPSCGLLVTAPGAKAPALLELSGPEQGQGWPQCERIESLAAFRLANRQYMAVGFIQRDTREDRYRYYDYFYRDAAGGYVPDPALSNVGRDGNAPARPQDGVKYGRAAYFRKTHPRWRFLDQHFISDAAASFAVFDEPKAQGCHAVVEAGAAPVDIDRFLPGARCAGILATTRLEQAGSVYYLALLKSATGAQGVAVAAVAPDGKATADERLAAAIVRAGATADVKAAKAALAQALR